MSRVVKRVSAVLLAVLLGAPLVGVGVPAAVAQTARNPVHITGNITTPTRWTIANDYFVDADITVTSLLVIDADVHVKFKHGSIAQGQTASSITVSGAKGRLVAKGTQNLPVWFESATPGGTWGTAGGGLVFRGTASGGVAPELPSVLFHADISGASWNAAGCASLYGAVKIDSGAKVIVRESNLHGTELGEILLTEKDVQRDPIHSEDVKPCHGTPCIKRSWISSLPGSEKYTTSFSLVKASRR